MEKIRIKKSLHGIADVSQSELTARMARISQHLDAVDALLADAKGLTIKTRRTTTRLRGPEEAAALSGVLAFTAARPELFAALGNEDDGVDPDKFETTLLTDRLANAQTLSQLADRFDKLRAMVADGSLYTIGLCKPAVLKAYEIAKPYRERDAEGNLLNAANDFYGRTGAKKHLATTSPPSGDQPATPSAPAPVVAPDAVK